MTIKMHYIDSRFVTGPENILFADVYEWTFQVRIGAGKGLHNNNDDNKNKQTKQQKR